jgi:pyrimidine operon attenuation protein / uracil phosphoribosyltransferase
MTVTYSDKDIELALEKIATDILETHANGDKIVLIGIIENGVHLAKRLQRLCLLKTKKRIPIGKLDTTLFRKDLEESDHYLKIQQSQIPCKLNGKTVILVNDFLDEGHDVCGALNALSDFDSPFAIELAVLADTHRTIYPLKSSYQGFVLETPAKSKPKIHLFENDGEDSVTFN